MYIAEEKIKIEQVIAVFHDYLQESRNSYGQANYELIWVEHFQYYILLINFSSSDTIQEKDLMTLPIQSAEELFCEMVFEIANDGYNKYGFANLTEDAIPKSLLLEAQTSILKRLSPYLKAFPEYQEAAKQIVIEHGKLYTNMDVSLDDFAIE